jgi:hypothetical protein
MLRPPDWANSSGESADRVRAGEPVAGPGPSGREVALSGASKPLGESKRFDLGD